MAKHAAPTSVTIASTTEETFLHRFVDRYWKAFVAVAALSTLLILFLQHRGRASAAAREASWSSLGAQVGFGGELNPQNGFPNPSRVAFPDASVLAGLATDLEETPAGPWAKALEVGKRLRDGDEDGARRAATELKANWPQHALVASALPFDGDAGTPRSLVDHIDARLQEIQAWEAEHAALFENPALPTDAPRVRFETTAGNLVLGLHAEEAPQHVANFLKQVDDGTLVGTKFHRVLPGQAVFGGDPNSIDGAPETWGLGGIDTTLAREPNALHHFTHVLAMDRAVGSQESSGSLFYITLAPLFARDGQYTVFGALIEGEDVLTRIASGPLEGNRPVDPVTIQATTRQP